MFFGVLTVSVNQSARVFGWLLFSLSVVVFFSIHSASCFLGGLLYYACFSPVSRFVLVRWPSVIGADFSWLFILF